MSKKSAPTAETLLAQFVACFETFNGSLGNSIQGWDYPRLHRVRNEAIKHLADEPHKPVPMKKAEEDGSSEQ